MNPVELLAGRRILLVEDDFIIADDFTAAFEAAGAEVVGPAATLQKALELLEHTERLDGAVLDINLQGDLVFEVVDALQGARRARHFRIWLRSWRHPRALRRHPVLRKAGRSRMVCEGPVPVKNGASWSIGLPPPSDMRQACPL
jgi:CheY-like chemotaxis protein